MADVMYRAGSGDVTVLPDLARLAIDRSQGALIRASAADYVARMLLGGYRGGGAEGAEPDGARQRRAAAPGQPRLAAGRDVSRELVNMLIAAAADPGADGARRRGAGAGGDGADGG